MLTRNKQTAFSTVSPLHAERHTNDNSRPCSSVKINMLETELAMATSAAISDLIATHRISEEAKFPCHSGNTKRSAK